MIYIESSYNSFLQKVVEVLRKLWNVTRNNMLLPHMENFRKVQLLAMEMSHRHNVYFIELPPVKSSQSLFGDT